MLYYNNIRKARLRAYRISETGERVQLPHLDPTRGGPLTLGWGMVVAL